MFNQILWTIDNETDWRIFERLCVELLFYQGYRDIVPIEPQDGGRDAEERPRVGRGRAGEATFFQFSLEKHWKQKLRKATKRIAAGEHEISTFVFVTNQKCRGVDRDVLTKEIRHKYGWDLVIYSREWLRLQLEVAHPEITERHFGISTPTSSDKFSVLAPIDKPLEDALASACDEINRGAFDRAAANLKDYLRDQPESKDAWKALSTAQYHTYRYDQALASINRAIKLGAGGIQAKSIRACILVEKGIRGNDKTSLSEGKKALEEILGLVKQPHWSIPYNFGNVLSALGNQDEAIGQYRKALQASPKQSQVLKNLASAYHLIGDHDAENSCLDHVLELEPTMPEALVCKGVSSLIDSGDAEYAADLLKRALQFNSDWAVYWPHIWYWLGLSCYRADRFEEGLKWVNDGLAHQPGHLGLKRLKSDLLERLASTQANVGTEARTFWLGLLAEEPLDWTARTRLIALELQQGREQPAWNLIDECFALMEVTPRVELRETGFTIEECVAALRFLPAYRRFREVCPISAYWDTADPLYDLSFEPPLSPEIGAALQTHLSISFGLAFEFLESSNGDRNSKIVLIEFFDTLRMHLQKSITTAARHLSPAVSASGDASTVADDLTRILMFLGLVALREFGRQRGWIAGQFGISRRAIADVCAEYNEMQTEIDTITGSLVSLNEELGIFPK